MLRKRILLQQTVIDPYVNDSNTLILLHLNSSLTNSGLGNSGIGNPVSSSWSIWDTTNKKFGYSSYLATNGVIYFSGSTPENMIKNALNNDFTIDYWVKVNNTSETYGDVYLGGYITDQSAPFIGIKTFGNYVKISSYTSGSSSYDINTTVNATYYYNSGWNHIAVIRNSNVLYLYINGARVSSWPFTATVPDQYTEVSFGGYYHVSGQYISTKNNLDEIRFSNVARWDTNFTPPTQEY